MKTQKVLSLSLLTLALAACGGSGGGGDSQPAQPVQPNQPTQPVQPTQPTQPAVQPTAPEVKPEQPKVEKPKDTITGYRYENFSGLNWDTSSNDLDKIKVWGTEIQLITPAMKEENNWLSDSSNGRSSRIVSNFLEHARLGATIRSGDAVVFAQGKATATENMPTVGKAHYKGQHILVVENSKEEQEKEDGAKYGAFKGEALFDVDFADKKLTGDLELPTEEGKEKSYLPVSATIKGNTFEKHGFIDDLNVSGKFYGENASEMAGVYQGRGKFTGAFGAKKQN